MCVRLHGGALRCCVLCDLLNYGQVNADPAKKDQVSVRVHDVRAVTGECSICSNEDEMLFALSMSCMHMPQMCKMCASRHLDGAFVRTLCAGMQDMICPVLGCKVLQRYPCCVFAMCNHAWQVVLTEDEIRRSIGDQKSNWEIRLSAGIQSSFDMVRCATPNCCGFYFPDEIRDRVSFLCVYCEQSTCVECLTLVHPGRTCSENMAVLQISDDLLDPFAGLVSFKRPTNGAVRGGHPYKWCSEGGARCRRVADEISLCVSVVGCSAPAFDMKSAVLKMAQGLKRTR